MKDDIYILGVDDEHVNRTILEETFEDDLSELFQHEIDHLRGVLATDYLGDTTAIMMRVNIFRIGFLACKMISPMHLPFRDISLRLPITILRVLFRNTTHLMTARKDDITLPTGAWRSPPEFGGDPLCAIDCPTERGTPSLKGTP